MRQTLTKLKDALDYEGVKVKIKLYEMSPKKGVQLITNLPIKPSLSAKLMKEKIDIMCKTVEIWTTEEGQALQIEIDGMSAQEVLDARYILNEIANQA